MKIDEQKKKITEAVAARIRQLRLEKGYIRELSHILYRDFFILFIHDRNPPYLIYHDVPSFFVKYTQKRGF